MPTAASAPLSFVRPRPPARVVTFEAAPRRTEIDLATSAVVVVDMQNDFLHPDGWFPRAGVDPAPLRAVIPAVAEVVAAARAAGVPVIWLNWGVRPDRAELSAPLLAIATNGGSRPVYADPAPSGRGRIAVAGDWGGEVVDELAPRADELTVFKHRLSGFWDNALDTILRNRGIDTLLFTGINIDRCVFATLCDASFLGYGCVLVEDACATPSPDFVREAILYLVRLLYGASATRADVIAALTSSHHP